MSEYKELIKEDENNFVLVDKKEHIVLSEYQELLAAYQAVKNLSRKELMAAYQIYSNPSFNVEQRIQDIQDLIAECEAVE